MRIPRGDAYTRTHDRATHMLNWLKKVFALDEASLSSGGLGERQAAEWLQRERGFVVVARNWRSPRDRRDEIDLVCRDGEVLVFVEVKTRSPEALVPGVYAVDARKKRVVRRTALAYMAGLAQKPRTYRFDIVEVVLAGRQKNNAKPADDTGLAGNGILHFENVALFSKRFRG